MPGLEAPKFIHEVAGVGCSSCKILLCETCSLFRIPKVQNDLASCHTARCMCSPIYFLAGENERWVVGWKILSLDGFRWRSDL